MSDQLQLQEGERVNYEDDAADEPWEWQDVNFGVDEDDEDFQNFDVYIGPTAPADAAEDWEDMQIHATEEFANTRSFSFTPDPASPDPEICPICLAEYEQDEELLELVHCRHIFHRPCLVEWHRCSNNKQCPYCRTRF